jgi:hypothetical protein
LDETASKYKITEKAGGAEPQKAPEKQITTDPFLSGFDCK